VIGVAGGTKAPQDTVRLAWKINRSVTFGTVATTATTAALATAIIVGDEIILSIGWVLTGSYPSYRRGFCTGRTLGYGAATTGTERAAECTVPPILTGFWITHIRDTVGALGIGFSYYWEHG